MGVPFCSGTGFCSGCCSPPLAIGAMPCTAPPVQRHSHIKRASVTLKSLCPLLMKAIGCTVLWRLTGLLRRRLLRQRLYLLRLHTGYSRRLLCRLLRLLLLLCLLLLLQLRLLCMQALDDF